MKPTCARNFKVFISTKKIIKFKICKAHGWWLSSSISIFQNKCENCQSKDKTLLPACELTELVGQLLYPEVLELPHFSSLGSRDYFKMVMITAMAKIGLIRCDHVFEMLSWSCHGDGQLLDVTTVVLKWGLLLMLLGAPMARSFFGKFQNGVIFHAKNNFSCF